MRMKQGEIVLFFMFFIRQITSRYTGRVTDILDKLNIDRNIAPLIVVVNPKKQYVVEDTADFDDLFVAGEDSSSDDADVSEEDPKEQAKFLLYSYLLRTGPEPMNTREKVENDKKNALRAALRNKCQARVQCEKKCEREEKGKYCPVNCKAVFDNLNICEPPKKKEESSCGQKETDPCKNKKRGKTMPPKWRF